MWAGFFYPVRLECREEETVVLAKGKFPKEIQKPLFALEGGIFRISNREHYICIADIPISFV